MHFLILPSPGLVYNAYALSVVETRDIAYNITNQERLTIEYGKNRI